MDFRLTPDQDAMRAALRDLLRSNCTPDVVRSQWQERAPGMTATSLWRDLGDIGILGVLAAEEHGGLGGNEIDLAGLMEECGYFCVPGPLVEHAAVGVPVLQVARPDIMDRVVAGSIVVTAASADRAAFLGARFPAAESAGMFVLVGPDQVVAAERAQIRLGDAIAGVDRSRTTWSAALIEGPLVAGVDPVMTADRATLAVAAQLIGLASKMLAMTLEYTKTRVQFGKAIGAQQAVKHHLARAQIAVHHARPVVYRAAYALAKGEPTAGRDVSFAKVFAYRAAHRTARSALQCHGAIGYTWEHDLHLWMKRLWALEPAWGSVREHERRVISDVIDGSSAERLPGALHGA